MPPAEAPLALFALAELPMLLLLLGLIAYIVLAGADFGAPLWALLARGEEGAEIREHTHRAMGPVWEANHVWLIFVLVVCWTAYPEAFGSIMSTLAVPLLLAAIGIIIRGTSYVLRSIEDRPWVTALFAASSVLTPFALGAALGGIASGRVPVGNAAGDLISSWLNPVSILIGLLAVAFCAYLSAVYLAGDGARIGSRRLAEAFRIRGLAAGLLAGALAIGGLAVLHADAGDLWDGLTSGAGLGAVIASAVAGAATLGLLASRRFEPARYCAALAVAATVVGWGIAQAPEILPGLTIDEAAAGRSTLISLLVSIAVGLLVLIPSLALLFGLVLGGRFDPGARAPATPPPLRARPPVPRRPGAILVLACLLAGLGLTLAFDGGLGLTAGVILLLAFIVGGFAMLAPAMLAGLAAAAPPDEP